MTKHSTVRKPTKHFQQPKKVLSCGAGCGAVLKNGQFVLQDQDGREHTHALGVACPFVCKICSFGYYQIGGHPKGDCPWYEARTVQKRYCAAGCGAHQLPNGMFVLYDEDGKVVYSHDAGVECQGACQQCLIPYDADTGHAYGNCPDWNQSNDVVVEEPQEEPQEVPDMESPEDFPNLAASTPGSTPGPLLQTPKKQPPVFSVNAPRKSVKVDTSVQTPTHQPIATRVFDAPRKQCFGVQTPEHWPVDQGTQTPIHWPEELTEVSLSWAQEMGC